MYKMLHSRTYANVVIIIKTTVTDHSDLSQKFFLRKIKMKFDIWYLHTTPTSTNLFNSFPHNW